MLRRVAFKKAILAGAAGAIVWEIVLRLLIITGLPFFDLIKTLGTLAFPEGRAWQWWPMGMLMHAAVGAIWAIFYAYFFWSVCHYRPTVQGIIFSLGPACLAGLAMV